MTKIATHGKYSLCIITKGYKYKYCIIENQKDESYKVIKECNTFNRIYPIYIHIYEKQINNLRGKF